MPSTTTQVRSSLDQPWRGSRQSLALSISEAAKICGVKRRTIRRRHQAGDFEHAFRDPDGTWRIPVYDLVAAGLRPPVVPDPDEPRIVFSAASQVDRLRTEVAILRERVRALEIIAKEREERVTDLRTILRMLPAPKVADEAAPPRAEEPLPPTLDVEEEPLEQEVREQPASEEVREAPAPRRPLVALASDRRAAGCRAFGRSATRPAGRETRVGARPGIYDRVGRSPGRRNADRRNCGLSPGRKSSATSGTTVGTPERERAVHAAPDR